MLNYLINLIIPKAHAVGTLTTADTTAIIENGIDQVLDNLIVNFPKIFLPMIVIGLFFGVIYWFIKLAGKKY